MESPSDKLEIRYQRHVQAHGEEPKFFIVTGGILKALESDTSALMKYGKQADANYVGFLFRGVPVLTHPWATGVHSAD